ncbi:MAG TPA: extracellular solute-binding protein [Candidatus Binatia bacterium]|nr:extracellular solute-binding protein [Candidatus Binatia bacterium]
MRTSTIVLTVTWFLFAAQASGQSPELVEAAKKEGGKVIIYGSLETPVVEAVIQAFRTKTGLDAQYWRASAMSVMIRSMGEYRAGNPIYDVVLNNSDPLLIMHQEGMIGKYDSTVMQKYPKDQINPRLGPISRYGIVGVLYNKSLVKPEDAPKALEDLVQPKYKGMLVMADPTLHVTTIQWVSSLHKVMSKDKADKYIRELAAMKPILVESMLPAGERVSTGEMPIAVTFVKYAYTAGKTGAPLDYVRIEKMLGDSHFAVMSNKAPHPNAAKAFIDYYLDDESMKILAQSGEFANRKGIYPPLAGADKIQYVQMEVLDAKAFEDRKKNTANCFCGSQPKTNMIV